MEYSVELLKELCLYMEEITAYIDDVTIDIYSQKLTMQSEIIEKVKKLVEDINNIAIYINFVNQNEPDVEVDLSKLLEATSLLVTAIQDYDLILMCDYMRVDLFGCLSDVYSEYVNFLNNQM